MKLQDIRKHAVRHETKISFALSNGMACIVDEHGVSRVPGLDRAPDFNLEEELARAQEFSLEPVTRSPQGKKAAPAAPRRLSREQMQALVSQSSAGAGREAEEHEE